MLRFVSALLLAASAVPAAAQSTAMPTADLVKGMQALVGQKFEGGIHIAAVISENNTIVFVFDGPAQWRQVLTAEQFSDAFIKGFCESSTHFFADGFTVRIDSTEQGATDVRHGPVVDRCP